MLERFPGEIAALTTALCWTITALSFEAAGKRVGSLVVNFLRLVLGLLFLSLFTLVTRGLLLPFDASFHAWLWLGLSGIVGFVIGDLFLFKAFVLIGSRISMLIMSLVPPLTAVCAWLIMGETISTLGLTGMALTILGIMIVILKRRDNTRAGSMSMWLSGIGCALVGAVGQAVGLVLSKYGMADYNAFASTQIRIIAGIIGFILVFSLRARWHSLGASFRNRQAFMFITLGSVFGPFLGVAFSLLAVQFTQAGIAATIIALVPIFIILPSIVLFHEKIHLRDVIGTLIAVTGVALLFLRIS